MIQSCLKKTIAVVLFVFALTVFAHPAHYLPANAQFYGSINISKLLTVPATQKYIPGMNEVMKEANLTIQDFDGILAFSIDFSNDGKGVNLTAVCELNKPVANNIFNKISNSSNDNSKRTYVYGKPAIEDKNGEFRLIQYSNSILVLQGHIEGKKTFLALNGKKGNQFTEIPNLINSHIAFTADTVAIIKMFVNEMFDKNDAEIKKVFSKIGRAALTFNLTDDQKIKAVMVLACKSVKDAADVTALCRRMINRGIKANPELKPILSRLEPMQEQSAVMFGAIIKISDIEKLCK